MFAHDLLTNLRLPQATVIYSSKNIAANLASLRAGEAHLWLSFVKPAHPAEQGVWKIVSDEERARLEKIRLTGNRAEFVLAHALVRSVLSQYHPIAPGAWQFARGPRGKPFISAPSDAPALQFNLTHTRGLAACVVALDAAAGVDAENIEPHADLPDVARQFFSAAAVRELEELSGGQRVVRFYEHWTCREAFGKASGVGLSSEPSGDENSADWQFLQQRVSPNHILAAVVRSGQGRATVFRLRTVGWQACGEECRLEIVGPERAVPARPLIELKLCRRK